MFGSGTRPLDVAKWTTLIISNEEMNDIIKIVKSLEESGLLIKGVSETIQNEAVYFITSLLRNILSKIKGHV